MKKRLCIVVLVVTTILGARPALAVDGSEVRLRSSTVPGAVAGAIGQLDTSLPDSIVFRVGGNPDITMPYAQITEFSYHTEVVHHLGVLGAIAVGLVKKRQRQHFITISYRDNRDTIQVTAFEISKAMPDVAVSLLRSKARSACERNQFGSCTPVVTPPVHVR